MSRILRGRSLSRFQGPQTGKVVLVKCSQPIKMLLRKRLLKLLRDKICH